jgi:hypothetical protein
MASASLCFVAAVLAMKDRMSHGCREDDTMTRHIAIIAACAGVFAVAQAAPAQASYAGADEFTGQATVTQVTPEPAIKLAQTNNPIPGVDVIVRKKPGGIAAAPGTTPPGNAAPGTPIANPEATRTRHDTVKNSIGNIR